MKETNIKIIEFGPNLKLFANRITLEGNELTSKQLQSACSKIGLYYNIAATPNIIEKGKQQILVYQYDKVPDRSITLDRWTVTPKTDNTRLILDYTIEEHRQLIADLYKRSLILQLKQNEEFWTFDSPRIFYEKTPINVEGMNNTDISAYRRFEISDVILDSEGLGFSVDVGTAFFTNLSVDDYLSKGYDKRFQELSGRQGEQQGTLLYDGPNKKVKCYFVKYLKNMTLVTGNSFRDNGGKEYENPYAYYQECYPNFNISPDDRVAKVSFPGFIGAKDVAANRLYLRVMNSKLPPKMKNLDKITPADREHLLTTGFWNKLGDEPFGRGFRTLQKGFYVPKKNQGGFIPLVDLKFGQGVVLKAPQLADTKSYRDHFRKRKDWFNLNGCSYVPPQMERKLIIVFPIGLEEALIEKYSEDLCQKITELTKISVEPVILAPYESILEATYQLREETDTGMILFVFENHDPASYYHISRELKGWKLKRATSGEMAKKYRNYKDNYRGRGTKHWESYIELTAYDVAEQMGCVPYIMPPELNYDMQLVIDVSEKSSHFGLSLMFYNQNTKVPLFQCQVHPKHDPKNKETINRVQLEKYLENLFNPIRFKLERHKPLNMLVLRDGKDCSEEYEAIVSVINNLKEQRVFGPNFYFDFAEYHKSSRKGIRIWERDAGKIENAIEGSYILLSNNQAVLNPTGSGTLRQGTAAPILIVGKHTPNINIHKVVEDIFMTSQLNFASPSVAQRLTFAAKRVDDQLIERRAQEVERIK